MSFRSFERIADAYTSAANLEGQELPCTERVWHPHASWFANKYSPTLARRMLRSGLLLARSSVCSCCSGSWQHGASRASFAATIPHGGALDPGAAFPVCSFERTTSCVQRFVW